MRPAGETAENGGKQGNDNGDSFGESAQLYPDHFVCIRLETGGVFCKEDNRIVMKLILNVTLPAAVIAGFSGYTRDLSLVLAAFLGFGLNIVMMFAGYLAAFRKSREEQTFNIVNYSGYNIGTFAMPYLQSFLGNTGTIVASIFDAGNALMCTGLTYAFAAGFCGKQVERGPGAFAARAVCLRAL